MTGFSNNDITAIASMFEQLNNMAYAAYKPMVDDICSHIATEWEVEHCLDYICSPGGDGMTQLFLEVCKKYRDIYPETISFYEREIQTEDDL